MIIKKRLQSTELKKLKSLYIRSQFSEKDEITYVNAERGYLGEQKLDRLLENLSSDCLILHDLLLEYNNSYFQIDTLVIYSQTIYILDVKNYEGVYFIEGDCWYSETGKKITNPIFQLIRCADLFRQWMRPLKVNFSIESYLIFINPDFTLFEAPRKLPIILPTQLNRFLKKLNLKASKITHKHKKLADYIMANCVKKSPFNNLPDYNYDQLQKGIICPNCNSFMSLLGNKKKIVVCDDCSFSENTEASIIRSAQEFDLLFPDRKITVTTVWEWCKIIESQKMIRRILKKHFKHISLGRFSYFVIEQDEKEYRIAWDRVT